jgi:GTP-binding protein Era
MKSGFVAVVGRPNVGKSTLVNGLVGSKVSIISSKPQTTRNVIRGIMTRREDGEPVAQAVLVDTPGLHKPRTALGERLNKLVYGTLEDVETIVMVLDATGKMGPGDKLVAERVKQSSTPVICVINKLDIASNATVLERLAEASEWEFDAYVPISAERGDELDVVEDEIFDRLEEGPMFFPPDAVSDQPEFLTVGEIIREKFLDRLRDELPHSLIVMVQNISERSNGSVAIDALAIVERDSQKGIVIGKGGEMQARRLAKN